MDLFLSQFKLKPGQSWVKDYAKVLSWKGGSPVPQLATQVEMKESLVQKMTCMSMAFTFTLCTEATCWRLSPVSFNCRSKLFLSLSFNNNCTVWFSQLSFNYKFNILFLSLLFLLIWIILFQTGKVHRAEWRCSIQHTSSCCQPGWGNDCGRVWWGWLLCWFWNPITGTQRSWIKPNPRCPGSWWSCNSPQGQTGDLCQAAKPSIKQAGCSWLVETQEPVLPLLTGIAIKYLFVPLSSAPSERLFSASGNVETKLRSSSLDPQNLEMVVFLHENMRKVKMGYDRSIIPTPAQANEVVALDWNQSE